MFSHLTKTNKYRQMALRRSPERTLNIRQIKAVLRYYVSATFIILIIFVEIYQTMMLVLRFFFFIWLCHVNKISARNYVPLTTVNKLALCHEQKGGTPNKGQNQEAKLEQSSWDPLENYTYISATAYGFREDFYNFWHISTKTNLTSRVGPILTLGQ